MSITRDTEIADIRETLIKERNQAIETLNSVIDDVENHEFQDEDDAASANASQSLNLRIKDRTQKYIKKLEITIIKIDQGDYGFCQDCGDDISIKRLIARPTAELCIDCKSEREREERILKVGGQGDRWSAS